MALGVTPATTNDLVLYQGTSFCTQMQWQSSGLNVDYTNDIHEVRSYLRSRYADSAPLVSMSSLNTSGPRIDISGSAGGAFSLIIPAEDTSNIGISRNAYLYFDVEFSTSAGHTWTSTFQTLFNVTGTTTEEVVTQLIRGKIRYYPQATK